MESATRCPFYLVSAFTTDAFAGNPAAVVFIDPTTVSAEYLGKLSANFNQPMLAAVSPALLPSDDPSIEVRAIRFIVPNGKDSPICGHATLATAKVIFGMPETIAKGIKELHFKTPFGLTIGALSCGDGFLEVQLPSATLEDIPKEEAERLKVFVDAAFGRNVKVETFKAGGGIYSAYLLIEIAEDENLGDSAVDHKALLNNGYAINVITSSSPHPDNVFVSRMFSPVLITNGEDQVCGSAHGLLVPYWYSKCGIDPGQEIKASQVSPRGGDLKVQWDKDEGYARLRGQCSVFASGVISESL